MLLKTLLVHGAILLGLAHARGAKDNAHFSRGPVPQYYADPDTTSSCSWWLDNGESPGSCLDVPDNYGISLADFLRWNPIVTDACANFNPFQSYCVEAADEPPGPTSTTITTTTTSSPGNGITTPTPTQATIVDNCNSFYFVKSGDSCAGIASANSLSVTQFITWNPSVGSDCTGLWANAYACIGIIGFTPPTTTLITTTTTTAPPGNGIETPQPIQPGMVSNCDAFHLVTSGQSCATIAALYRISLTEFTTWNPDVGGSACSGLWANAYVCVSIIGHTPPPPTTTTTRRTTTTQGNGVATPTPTQEGMVTNCDTFHLVTQGQTCETIARLRGITVANFIRWNPAVGSSCTGLWANTYACVGLI